MTILAWRTTAECPSFLLPRRQSLSMSKQSTLQKFLGTLKTAQNLTACGLRQAVFTTISENPIDPSSIALFSELNPSSIHRILSDRYIHTSTCLRFYQFILQNHSSLPFELDLRSHLILICRLIKATNFTDAEKLLKSVAIDQIQKYPFSVIASCIDGCSVKARTRDKFFNCMLNIYSDNELFDEAVMVFDYAKGIGIKIDEKTCAVLLLALKRSDCLRTCLDFFNRMIASGMEVSVYPLTIVVCALCSNGNIKMGRELVEEISKKGIVKPNVVTFNVLVAACVRRWNFVELELVLGLMKEEAVELNLASYKFLIDGFTSSGKAEEAERLLLEMHEKGLKVDAHPYNLIISAYFRSGLTRSALHLFDEMGQKGVVMNSDTCWGLVTGLCKAVEMEKKMVADEGTECQDLMVEVGFDDGKRHREINKQEEIQRLLSTMKRFNRSH